MKVDKKFKYLETKGMFNELTHNRLDVTKKTDKSIFNIQLEFDKLNADDNLFYMRLVYSDVKLDVF